MIEPRADPDLIEEPVGAEQRAKLRAEDLDSDVAIVLRVVGEKDGRHAASAEQPDDLVSTAEHRLESTGGHPRSGRVHGRGAQTPGAQLLHEVAHTRVGHRVQFVLHERRVHSSHIQRGTPIARARERHHQGVRDGPGERIARGRAAKVHYGGCVIPRRARRGRQPRERGDKLVRKGLAASLHPALKVRRLRDVHAVQKGARIHGHGGFEVTTLACPHELPDVAEQMERVQHE